VNSPQNDYLVEVDNMKMYFPVLRGLLKHKIADVKAVDGVSFKIRRGETLGLVGESGCGKTTTGRCILRIYEPTAGQVLFDNKDITSLSMNQVRPLRREMSFIFQDPFGSLDPRQTAGSIVGEPLHVHNLTSSKKEFFEMVENLFLMVGLDSSMVDRVPNEFSGGQRPRIGIARISYYL